MSETELPEENGPQPEPEPQSDVTAEQAPTPAPARRLRERVKYALVLLLALAALALVVLQAQRMTAMQTQVARLLDEAGKRSIAAKTASEQAGVELHHVGERLALLEARVRDLTAYREQMRDLVQTVVEARDESLLASLDASLLLAQDQAQLTDNPQPMVVALRAAKRRIAQSTDVRLIPVRHAVERDLQRLKLVQVPDTAGLLARLDAVLDRVDELPLSADVRSLVSGGEPSQAADAPAAPAHWWSRWRRWLAERICGPWCKRDTVLGLPPDVPLQDQAFLVRQNLRQRLLSAKLGLLSRQHEAVRADLAAAVAQLQLGFEAESEAVSAAMASLEQVRALAHGSVLPQLDDTLAALGRAGAQQQNADTD